MHRIPLGYAYTPPFYTNFIMWYSQSGFVIIEAEIKKGEPMLEPKEVEIPLQSYTTTVEEGKTIKKFNTKTFTLSKIPAVAAREIVCKYPMSSIPKLGDYAVNEENMLKLMSYVAVKTETGELRLTTRSLVDNHVPDWEALARIEIEMLKYNCSFFTEGKILSFLDSIKAKAQQSITSTLTALSPLLSQMGKPPTKS